VSDIFAATPEAPMRRCPHCGSQDRTRYEHCPVCGCSYFVAPPRFSRRTRRALALVATVTALSGIALLVVVLKDQAADNATRERTRQAAAVARERRRLIREQKPHHGAAGVRLPAAETDASARRAARRRMVAHLQERITADARGRVARGELTASAVRATRCGPLNPGQRIPDENDLDRSLGRYSCLAVTQSARRHGATSELGIPFVAVIDFRRGALTWCKDNPVSPSDIKSQLAFVRLARECTAARGPAFGSGYLVEPREG
jgi:hypothetical protein